MRIYAAADIHGKQQNIAVIYQVIDQFRPDLIVAPGDLTHFFNWQTGLSQLDSLPVPVLAIRGNTDFRQIESRIKKAANITLLNENPVQIKGFSFVGLSGTLVLPFANRICLNEKKALKALPCPMPPDTIMVVHPPPKGTCDMVAGKFHSGSLNLARFIKMAAPSLLLCGHIHEDPGENTIGNTTVVNCAIAGPGLGAVIDLEKNSPPKVNLLQPDALQC